MLRPLLAVLAVVAVAFSGCSDSNEAPKAQPNPGGFEPTEDTGIIQGILVDEAIRPLAGVTVVASGAGDSQSAQSDESGFFGFEGLAPGTWFLRASKLGYDPAQQSVDVVAGEADPPLVKILLLSNPELRPYSETFPWTGFLQCSAGIPEVGSVNPCFISPDSSNVYELNVSKVPTFVQAEMVWRPASVVGSSFILSAFVPTDDLADADGVDDYAESEGPSPLVVKADQELLAEKGVGTDHPYAIRVFPGTDQPTVFANQAFDVYITVFYGYAPPADWTFIGDGAYESP